VTEPHILVEQQGTIRTISWNRPEKKNALTVQMYADAVVALKEADADPSVRVIVFLGKGSAFTAGNDLLDFMNNPPASVETPVFQFLLQLTEMEKPIVVGVHGPAVGIGVTMLLHCDLVYVADDAKLTMPFVSLGVVPEGASSFYLPRIMGHAKASELLMLGETIDGKTAVELGIAARSFPASDLVTEVQRRAQTLSEKAPGSVRGAKKLLRDNERERVRETLLREGALFLEKLGSDEAREAFTAFFEKRKPDFSRFT
jgi:enoyl-CoA hydratase/carnithine racemase